jgi:hypothetical protein
VAIPESVLPPALRMEATLAAVEPAASSLDPRRTRMAAVYLPLYQDTQLGRVSHLCT